MTQKEFESLRAILGSKWHMERLLREFLANAEVEERPAPETRTNQQSRSLHLWLSQVAEALNDAGESVQDVMKVALDCDWNQRLAKELLWRRAQVRVLGKESTTELKKQGDIDKVYDHLCRHLGEKFGIEVPPWPSESMKGMERLASMHEDVRNDADYPELDKMPEF